jgi:hypothetical protein
VLWGGGQAAAWAACAAQLVQQRLQQRYGVEGWWRCCMVCRFCAVIAAAAWVWSACAAYGGGGLAVVLLGLHVLHSSRAAAAVWGWRAAGVVASLHVLCCQRSSNAGNSNSVGVQSCWWCC